MLVYEFTCSVEIYDDGDASIDEDDYDEFDYR